MAFWRAAEVLYANFLLYQTEYFSVFPVLHLQKSPDSWIYNGILPNHRKE